MKDLYVIPLTADPNQTFRCVIPIDGDNKALRFFLSYNAVAKYWNMRISDDNNNTIVDSIPIITGEYPAANILEPYSYLNIGSATVVPVGSMPPEKVPDDANLGTEFFLVWGNTI